MARVTDRAHPIRCVIADDHALVRAGLAALLAQETDMQVVGEAGDGKTAIELARTLKPDVLLVDLALPGLPGLEVAQRVVAETPAVRVVIVSMHKSEEYVFAAIRSGAAGYVVKEDAAQELPLAVRAAAEGGIYLSPMVAESTRGRADDPPPPVASPQALTPREREVLVLISEGLSTKEIAKRLGISVKTADAHRQGLMRRIGIHDVAGLVKFAVRHGLTQP